MAYTVRMSKPAVIELLINTRSRSGQQALPRILAGCEAAGVKLANVIQIKDPSVLPDVLAGIKSRRPDIFITASGDGTVSDVVDYLAGTPIKLGFIPLGTTNNFARSLGVPLDIDEAVAVILSGRTRRIALGMMDGDYFANVAGIGMSARIAEAVTSTLKKRYGRLAYAITAFRIMLTHKPFMVKICDKDGELQAHFMTHQVIVANGRYHAGTEIAVDADLAHPELVVFKLGGPSRLSLIWHMLDFYYGKRRSVAHSSYFIGRDIKISTSTPQPIELDGEVKLQTPSRASAHADAVTVFC